MYYVVSLDILVKNTIGDGEANDPYQSYQESWNLNIYNLRDHSIPKLNSILQVGYGLDTSVSVLVEIPDDKYDGPRARRFEAFKQGKQQILDYLGKEYKTHFKSDL